MCTKRPRGAARGFTLIEVIVATIIIGVGVSAIMLATGSSTELNGAGRDMAQATFLLEEIHERTVGQDIDAVASGTYSPPIDAAGTELTGLSDWSQVVTAAWADPNSLSSVPPTDPEDPDYRATGDVKYVGCEVRYGGRTVRASGWFLVRRQDDE